MNSKDFICTEKSVEISQLIPTLNKFDIFAFKQPGDMVMLYAPMANVVAEIGYDEMLTLEHQASKGLYSSELAALLDKEVNLYKSQLPDMITELSILINQRCNFSCAYCYSANGRDNKEMSLEQLISIIDWFIDKKRGSSLDITFSGGGDPMLSFNLLRKGIEFAFDKARSLSIKINIGIVTNGSTLTHEQMDFISQYNIGLVVSYDIIEDVHNAQRSHYDIVTSTIDELCHRNIKFGIRSTITPLNVTRQEEMVEVLHKRFPMVSSAAFEAVLNKSLFPTSKDLDKFYLDFEEHIFNAQILGTNYGITIGNTIINNVDTCKERACLGKLVATPYGDITACSRISSSKEAHFSKFVYGRVDTTGVYVDNIVVSKLLERNVRTYKECYSCIAKYHCSGGCLLARYSLPTEYFKCYCDFMKRMVVHRLKQQMEE